jgi:hypothetical protein
MQSNFGRCMDADLMELRGSPQRNDTLLTAADAEPGAKGCGQQYPGRCGNGVAKQPDEHHAGKIDRSQRSIGAKAVHRRSDDESGDNAADRRERCGKRDRVQRMTETGQNGRQPALQRTPLFPAFARTEKGSRPRFASASVVNARGSRSGRVLSTRRITSQIGSGSTLAGSVACVSKPSRNITRPHRVMIPYCTSPTRRELMNPAHRKRLGSQLPRYPWLRSQ